MVEFGVPHSAPLRAAWRVYTRAGLPLIGRAVSPAWFEVGRFLGPNIEEFHAQEPDLPSLWGGAGIDDSNGDAAQLRRGAGDVWSETVVTRGVRNGVASAPRELDRPAFYALRSGGWRDLVTLLASAVHRSGT